MSVTIPKHVYARDQHSGAGNCWCGRPEESRLHPHKFTPAYVDPTRCVCGGFANDAMHVDPGRWFEQRSPRG
jgi:hypothetical protein